MTSSDNRFNGRRSVGGGEAEIGEVEAGPGRRRGPSPGCIFLSLTLLVTLASSGLMTLALMTDFWEYVDYDPERLALSDNLTRLEWVLERRVARITSGGEQGGRRTTFLVPMYGGVWTLCTNLNAGARTELGRMGFAQPACVAYLSPEYISEGNNDWMTRLQNLSISCTTVCLILLGASALLGLFGLFKRQISAVLVTGVLYILAGVFCVFTLSIMHFKRKTSKDCGLNAYAHAQLLSTGWSLAMGWVSVFLCFFTAFLWYFLSKIMRFGPITLV